MIKINYPKHPIEEFYNINAIGLDDGKNKFLIEIYEDHLDITEGTIFFDRNYLGTKECHPVLNKNKEIDWSTYIKGNSKNIDILPTSFSQEFKKYTQKILNMQNFT